MKTLALYSIKGGVGKTAAAVNLAWLAAGEGARTLLLDLDPQGAATWHFRVKPRVRGGGRALVRRDRPIDAMIRATDRAGLDLLPADFSYRNLDLALGESKRPERRLRQRLSVLAPHYDLLFMDCAPGISLVSESVFGAADALVVPLLPSTLSLRTWGQLCKHLQRNQRERPQLLPFFSMVDCRRRLHGDTISSFHATGTGVLSAVVPYAADVERMGPQRAPLFDFAPDCPAARAYRALWAEILARLQAPSAG